MLWGWEESSITPDRLQHFQAPADPGVQLAPSNFPRYAPFNFLYGYLIICSCPPFLLGSGVWDTGFIEDNEASQASFPRSPPLPGCLQRSCSNQGNYGSLLSLPLPSL